MRISKGISGYHSHSASRSCRHQILPGMHMSALQALRDVADLHMAAKAISEEGGSKVGVRGLGKCEGTN